jgi:hypothetical protein
LSGSFPEFVDVLLTRDWMTQTMTRRLSHSGSLIVDDVFKLEEIDRFWPAFAARTGVRLEPLHANQSRPQHYDWDARHVAMMHARFRDDFVNFKYE